MTSHTVQSSRDWLRTPRTNFLAWWIPQASILAGLLVPVPIRGAVWSVLHAEHSSKGVQMLAITIESGTLDKIKPKVAQFEMKYPVLVGDDKAVEGFGGQRGFPTTYVVTKDWKIYKKYLGIRADKRELIEKDIEKLLVQ